MSDDILLDLIDDDLSDEALDTQSERYCMGSCGCKQVVRLSGFCR